ncbi:hypothetical protein SmJEL517_g02164 [Synchytrium microbalum]|uniref:NAD(P)-binding domain-containing protein n=1 Tax=Synchytrium microbalum TaxID=1806994 RepID=A0A507C8V0_9FUNG|nr:uncharacterized protein SmJEL517_g02164 [Synchytrium microbalum]TPX35579.1 hypothetical protein SmJEL517_g02164 [Synchytrium microbalum]
MSLQKLLVFGGSGRIGRMVCQYALETKKYGVKDGYVSAFVRNAIKLRKGETEQYADQIDAYEGNVRDIGQVRSVIKEVKPDKIVSVIGPKDIRDPSVINSIAALHISLAMKENGVKRLILMTANGLLPRSTEDASIGADMYYETGELPVWLNHACYDMRHATELIMSTDLDWTLVCPPYMPKGPFLKTDGKYRVVIDGPVENGKVLAAADCADFIVKALDRDDLIRHRVGIAY